MSCLATNLHITFKQPSNLLGKKMTDFMPHHEDQELDNNTSDNTHFRDILE